MWQPISARTHQHAAGCCMQRQCTHGLSTLASGLNSTDAAPYTLVAIASIFSCRQHPVCTHVRRPTTCALPCLQQPCFVQQAGGEREPHRLAVPAPSPSLSCKDTCSPCPHLEAQVQRVRELEVGGLGAGADHGIGQVHSTRAAQAVVLRHSRLVGAWWEMARKGAGCAGVAGCWSGRSPLQQCLLLHSYATPGAPT